jgi:ubiquinone/menaquinone biosynthesis C-methylase UbiE
MTAYAIDAAVDAHAAHIADQFTRQAAGFARSRALHNKEALDLLVDAARPKATYVSLDVACGPGSVVLAFAAHVARAKGLDATEAMLEQARQEAARRSIGNVDWHQGDAYALPFADASFDIVSCRFAMHHLEQPVRAFAEMVRVCRPGGRVVLCDAFVSDDPAKAAAFNAMERLRDPSTVEFRALGFLRGMFAAAGLPDPEARFYEVPFTLEEMVTRSFPAGEDRNGLRAILEASVDGDVLGMGARREGDAVHLAYPAVVLVAVNE